MNNDLECPRCKTTKYRNPQLKLLVNVCGHPLCEKCIELLFANGAAKCYQCPTPLKRGNFKKQLFEDSQVEKDIQVRRDILRKFSKNQDAFESLRAYNDFLEKLETIIYNLANDIDLDETNKLLDELRRPDVAVPVKRITQLQDQPYYHKALRIQTDGPELPKIDQRYYSAMRQLSKREKAGGFTADLAIGRALGDAFINLFSKQFRLTSVI